MSTNITAQTRHQQRPPPPPRSHPERIQRLPRVARGILHLLFPFPLPLEKNITNTAQIEKNAYPAEAPKEKKQKVKKDKGSKYPGGAKGSETQAEEGKDAAEATTRDVGKSASEAMGKLSVE